MDLSIIVPVFNEQDSLKLLYAAVVQAVDPLGCSWELVLVDDGSKDKSVAVLAELILGDPEHIRVVELRRNFGQTAAIAAGIDHSEGDIVILMDADLQNDPADIPMMLEKIDEGYDVVSGWRKDRQDTFSRRLPSQIANHLISRVTGVHLHDLWLHAQGLPARSDYRVPPVRRNAPLYPGLCQFGWRSDHGNARSSPRAQVWQSQIWSGTHAQSGARPGNGQVPEQLCQ